MTIDPKVLSAARHIDKLSAGWHSGNAEAFASKFARALIEAAEEIEALKLEMRDLEARRDD